jgi:hypothetical protein
MYKFNVRKKPKLVKQAIDQQIDREKKEESPAKGILKLLKIWNQNAETLPTFGTGQEGLANWLKQNSVAVGSNGKLDYAKLSLILSNLKLPQLKFDDQRASMVITVHENMREIETSDLDAYGVPVLGVKNESDLTTVEVGSITGLTIISLVEGKHLVKRELNTEELNEFIENKRVTINDIDPNLVTGIYGVTGDGPTVVSGKWRIRHWRIEVQDETGTWNQVWP